MTDICVSVCESTRVCARAKKPHSQRGYVNMFGVLGFPTDSTASWSKPEHRSTSFNYSPILSQIMILGRLKWSYWVNEAILLIL